MEYVGGTGSGTLIQSGGTNNCSGAINVGFSPGSSGTYNQSGGQLFASSEYVGDNAAAGTFTQSAGTNNCGGTLYVGYNSGSSGTYIQSGGVNSLNNASGTLYLGYNGYSSGSYNLSAGSLSAGYEYVGNSGAGTFTQSGGTNTCRYPLYVGYNSGSSGTYNQSGGVNTITNNAPLYLGDFGSSSGSYNLSGSGSLSAVSEYLGYTGSGTFTQSGGTNNIGNGSNPPGYLYLGYNSGAGGTYNLSGSGLLSASYENVGQSGTGTFTQSGGTNACSSNLYLTTFSSGTCAYNLSGAGLLTAANEYAVLPACATSTSRAEPTTVPMSCSLAPPARTASAAPACSRRPPSTCSAPGRPRLPSRAG